MLLSSFRGGQLLVLIIQPTVVRCGGISRISKLGPTEMTVNGPWPPTQTFGIVATHHTGSSFYVNRLQQLILSAPDFPLAASSNYGTRLDSYCSVISQ
jgi:hypothetical protein